MNSVYDNDLPFLRKALGVIGRFAIIGVVLLIGVYAERNARDLAIQNERARVDIQIDQIRLRLEQTVQDYVYQATRLEGTMQTMPSLTRAEFENLIDPFLNSDYGILGIMATTGPNRYYATKGIPSQLVGLLNDHLRLNQSTRVIKVLGIGGRTAMLVQVPFLKTDLLAQHSRPHVGFLVDLRVFLDRASAIEDASNLAIQLETRYAAPQSIFSSPDFHAANTPVAVEVSMGQEAWRISAHPVDGWAASTSGPWAVRLLTLLTVVLILLYQRQANEHSRQQRNTIRKLADRSRQLADASRRFDLALEVSGIGIWELDVGKQQLFMDGKMRALYGLPDNNSLISFDFWREFVVPEDVSRLEAAGLKSLVEGAKYDEEFRINHPEYGLRYIHAVALPFGTLETECKMVGVAWDVTKAHELELEMLSQKKEIEDSEALKSRHFATMTHEIRTPLNGVLGLTDLMLQDELSPRQRERANIVRDSATHLLDIVNDLLDLSKLDQDSVSLVPEAVNLREISDDVVSLMSGLCIDKQVKLLTTYSDRLPKHALCDPTRFRQVLMNLVANAVKYTDEGFIEVRVDYEPENDDRLVVRVSDTGIGIDKKHLPTLFERYNQVSTPSTRRRGGTGLGLAICKELVTLMGGEIHVRSELKKGTTFDFWIPAPSIAPAAQTSSIPRPDKPKIELVRDATDGPRILVAEDNPIIQRILSGYLSAAGHDATFVANGVDAVAEATSGKYDIIFLDVEMPIMTGIEAARRIRQVQNSSDAIPIIALTSHADQATFDACILAGMNKTLGKPTSVETLSATIDRYCPKQVQEQKTDPTQALMELTGSVGE